MGNLRTDDTAPIGPDHDSPPAFWKPTSPHIRFLTPSVLAIRWTAFPPPLRYRSTVTLTTSKREHGGELHWTDWEPGPAREAMPWPGPHSLFRCGRDALHALVALGRRTRGWTRVLTPTYGCEKTVRRIMDVGLPVVGYRFAPTLTLGGLDEIDLRPGDVVIATNVFGHFSADTQPQLPVDVIEDHTHDPWAHRAVHGTATFGIASLRKTLPAPDGAVVWSPRGLDLPRGSETSGWAPGVREKYDAMRLKRTYLDGGGGDRDHISTLFRAGGRGMDEGGPYTMSALSQERLRTFPARAWRRRRRINFDRVRRPLESLRGLTLLTNPTSEPAPFALAILSDTNTVRDSLRDVLTTRGIESSILWPLDRGYLRAVGPQERDVLSRMLCIHCDGRYDEHDMDRIASTIRIGLEQIDSHRVAMSHSRVH